MKTEELFNKRDIAVLAAGVLLMVLQILAVITAGCLRGFQTAEICCLISVPVQGGIYFYLIKKWVIPAVKLNRLLNNANESEDIDGLIEKLDETAGSDYSERLFAGITDLINREQKAQLLSTEATIHVLQSQINPHFLYNTLETIRSKAILQGNEEIAKMNEALATLFRYNISRPGEMATLAEEMENVDSYLIIQQYRFRDKFKVTKIYDESDDYLMSYMMPVLTIQPIVENAIHHGLESKVGKGEIIIRAFTTQNRLTIIVSDDGVGIPQEQLKIMKQKLEAVNSFTDTRARQKKSQGRGIALQNVLQRIKFYYGEEYDMEITSVEGCGTTVEIWLPKIYDFKRRNPDV